MAQTLLGLALAFCEDGPMAGISIYFFVQRYQIPVFQVRAVVPLSVPRCGRGRAAHFSPTLM